MATKSATLNSATSTDPTASVPRRARRSERTASAPIISPASTNLVPSHGSAPSRTKQANASRRRTRSDSRSASSAAPASAAPALSSGYTAVPYAMNGGERPSVAAAPIAHGSGTTRSASR